MKRTRAIALAGPSGSGKSPLGDRLDARGVWGRRCCHFDFGVHLRAAVAGAGRPPEWSDADVALVRTMLDEGTLLEKKDFRLAETLVSHFQRRRRMGPDDVTVMNGWPRHVEQAEAVERVMEVGLVVYLVCDRRTVAERIRRNTGGDRAGRTDDTIEHVTRKWAVFKKRTEPLLDHYRGNGVKIVALNVGVETTADDMIAQLETQGDPWLNAV